jgi:hypothetical protein
VETRPRPNLAQGLVDSSGGGVFYDDGDVMKFWRFYKWYRAEGKSLLLSIKLAWRKA